MFPNFVASRPATRRNYLKFTRARPGQGELAGGQPAVTAVGQGSYLCPTRAWRRGGSVRGWRRNLGPTTLKSMPSAKTTAHIEALRELGRASERAAHEAAARIRASQEPLSFVPRDLTGSPSRVFRGQDDLAVIYVSQHKKPELWIDDINVYAHLRGEGFGAKIIASLVDWARAAGFTVIAGCLRETDGDLERRAAFVKKHGFDVSADNRASLKL